MAKHPAGQIAARLLALHFFEQGEDDEEKNITNMKLQKLLYYAQGASLALDGNPLFDEPLIALPHGPVVQSVYEDYRKYKDQPIEDVAGDWDVEDFTDDDEDLLDQVMAVFGRDSATELRNRSHHETPWRNAVAHGYGTPLDLDEIQQYFREHYITHV